MGNRAKRVAVAAALKKQGLGKLYTGNKKAAWRYFKARILKELLRNLAITPGSVVNDCDGQNHYVKKWLPSRWPDRDGGVIILDQFEREDGYWSCGCGTPDAPLSREEIEANWLAIVDADHEKYVDEWYRGAAATAAKQRLKDIKEGLKNGGHVCDENGVLLPAYRRRLNETE